MDDRFVLEQQGGLDAAQVGRAAERVAGRGDVVVPQYGIGAVAGPQPGQLALEGARSPSAADEVAGDGDEVEIARRRPVDRLP